MTTEEMQNTWPHLPPFKADYVIVVSGSDVKSEIFEINQDTIEDIIRYFQACQECMNS